MKCDSTAPSVWAQVGQGRRKAKRPGHKGNASSTRMQWILGHGRTSLTRLKKLFSAGFCAGELEQFCCREISGPLVVSGFVEAHALCWGTGECLMSWSVTAKQVTVGGAAPEWMSDRQRDWEAGTDDCTATPTEEEMKLEKDEGALFPL